MTGSIRGAILTIAASAFLCGCAGQPETQTVTATKTICLPLATFTPSEDQELATELAELQNLKLPMITKAVLDDEAMRMADRACLSK